MNKKERAAIVKKVLNELFPHPEIPLQHSSPYTLLIAVLLCSKHRRPSQSDHTGAFCQSQYSGKNDQIDHL